jgi:hypothetical protein
MPEQDKFSAAFVAELNRALSTDSVIELEVGSKVEFITAVRINGKEYGTLTTTAHCIAGMRGLTFYVSEMRVFVPWTNIAAVITAVTA